MPRGSTRGASSYPPLDLPPGASRSIVGAGGRRREAAGGPGMPAPSTTARTDGAGRGSGRRSLGAYLVDGRPLRLPAYRRLWIASAIAAVGGSFSGLAIPTQLFTLTGSSATVGFSGIVSFVALVISALW